MGRSSNTIMSTQSVQTFGKKKTATAVAHVKNGKGLITINGSPITLVQPEILRFKVYEPLTLVGLDKFQNIDIRVKVTGGGHISQVYVIRQAIAKGLVAYHQKFVDEASKNELKKIFASYDKTLLVADSRRMEPRKFLLYHLLTVKRKGETRKANIFTKIFAYALPVKLSLPPSYHSQGSPIITHL